MQKQYITLGIRIKFESYYLGFFKLNVNDGDSMHPIQPSIIKLTCYYFFKVETDFCVQCYISSDMHYFV